MMNLLKKNLAFLLAVVLCLSLTACGGDNDVVVGDDWRSSGDVVASGTITREDGDVDVLVTVDDNSASFYWDDPEHTLFDSVDFPFTIPNAQECFEEISFADLTANGESDVEISFTSASGTTYLTWLWDLEGYYVFRGDLSTYTIDGADLSEYVGLWQWANESLWLNICEDETWTMLDDEENMVQAGSLWLSETGIVLYFYETGDVVPLDVTVSGDLVNIENEMMFVPANNSVDLSEYVGLWEYVGENLWLCIYDDETWSFFNDQEVVIASGTLLVDENGITLCFDDTGDVMQLDFAESGDLLDVENNGTLVPADKIESRVPCFTRNGLEINAEVDVGTYLLKNGACSYYNLGKNYTVGDCYWEVIKNYDVTHDGIREIQFDAVCYVPSSSLGIFDQEFIISTRSGLYDFYTGKWFNTDNDHTEKNHTERLDNHYVNTLEWNGQSYEVEYSYSTEAEFFVADWYMVYTASYLVYLPEGYDGLLFVAEPEAKTYEEHMKWSDPTADYYLTEENSVDLFFSVCD